MPLTILMVSDVDPVQVIGGAERILNEHSRRLAARGHRVIVLTRREDPERAAQETVEGVQVCRHPVGAGNPVAFYRSVLREGGRAFGEIAGRHAVDLVNVHQPLAAAGVLRSPLAAAYPCLYTFLSPWADEYLTRAEAGGAARRLGILSPARRAYHGLNAAARRRVERRCLDASRHIMALSEFSAGQLAAIHNVPRDRVAVIPGGVDTACFRPASDRAALKRELGLPLDRSVMLTVRNLVPRMGIESLLAAMVRVHHERPDACLVVGGSGPLSGHLWEQARELGLEGCVSFTGFIPEGRLPHYYAAADLFILPTRYLEGFGLVTIEALACGTPVLGTPVGGTQEILRGLDPGLLLRSADAEDLAEGILSHLADLRGSDALRRRCRTCVEENYSWDVLIPRIEALFYAIAGRRVSGRETTDH